LVKNVAFSLNVKLDTPIYVHDWSRRKYHVIRMMKMK